MRVGRENEEGEGRRKGGEGDAGSFAAVVMDRNPPSSETFHIG